MQHRVRDLPEYDRQVVEKLLGRPVGENETIFIRSVPVIKEGPSAEQRLEVADELESYFKRINPKLEGIDEREFDEAAEEAIREVRRSHQAVK